MSLICSKLLLPLWLFFQLHPLHVSTTEMNFNQKEKSVEISVRIFTDDFERILANNYKVKTDLSKPSMQKTMDELVAKYMASHLKVQLNGKATTANYIGFELDHEATNVYLEIENVNELKSVNLTNSILYDLFDDQMNILHVSQNGIRKSARANYPQTGLETKF